MAIPFTQYLQPNGAKRAVVVDADADTEAKAKILLDRGYHFDIEILTTGIVSLTCEDDDDVISIELCENGPGITEAIQKLVQGAYERTEKQDE